MKNLILLLTILYSNIIITRQLKIKLRDVKTEFYYGTHLAPLLTAVSNTAGPVLELGGSDFSTPLLHALCQNKKRYLLTLSNDEKELSNFLDLENSWHEFRCGHSFLEFLEDNPIKWSVVLVDHYPAYERGQSVLILKDKAEVFVMHDAQEPKSYDYERVFNSFKYVYIYERYNITTAVISDTIDISKWFDN